MALATLTIDINAKLASIEKDLGRVSHLAEQEARKIDAAFAKAGATIAGLAAGATFAGLVSGFRSVVDQLDKLNDIADATGASIENISGLEDVAKRTGASIEDVSSILVKFNAALKEADTNNGVGAVLKAIGLSTKELKSIDPAEALQKVAVALSGYADDGNKARLVQVLFGKSIKEAAPFLKDLAESGKLNAKVTTQQAEAAERFNKQIFAAQAGISELSRNIVSAVLPAIQSMIEHLNNGTEAYGSFFKATMDIGLNVDPLKSLNENITATVVRIREVRDRIKEIQTNGSESLIGSLLDKGELGRLNDELGLLEKREKYLLTQSKSQGGARGVVPEKSRPPIPDIPAKESEKISEGERYLESLRKQLEAAQHLTEVEKVLADIQAKPGLFKNAQEAGKAFDLAGQVDQAKEMDQVWAELFQTLDESQKLASKNAEEAARYFEASLSPAEKLEATIKRINELYAAGSFGTVGSAEAIEKQARAIKAARNETDQLNESAKELADIFTRAAERGDDLGKALETIVKKKLLFDPMSKALEAGFSDLLGGIGSFFNSNTSSSSSSLYSLSSGSGIGLKIKTDGSHANGLDYVPFDGYVAKLHKGEKVLTAKQAASGSGGVVVNNYNTIGSGVSRAEVAAAMEATRQQTIATILESKRNRGAFA